jgi:hypothetical protein
MPASEHDRDFTEWQRRCEGEDDARDSTVLVAHVGRQGFLTTRLCQYHLDYRCRLYPWNFHGGGLVVQFVVVARP